jgi:hypothetical protein
MKTRTFNEIWQDIYRLQDIEVFTLRHHNKNHIMKVDETGLITSPDRSRYPHTHPITKGAFETVWRKLLAKRDFMPVEDGGYHLVCACMALLPEVEYSLNPVTISLTENKHDFGTLVEKT